MIIIIITTGTDLEKKVGYTYQDDIIIIRIFACMPYVFIYIDERGNYRISSSRKIFCVSIESV